MIHSSTSSHTVSGKHIDVFNIDRKQISLDDIAHHLSMICRYGGATPRFYSVAEHACHVSDLVFEITGSHVAALMGLHHDDHEAYIHDIRRPLKNALIVSPFAGGRGAHMFSQLEDTVQAEIEEALVLPVDRRFDDIVKACDTALLGYEMTAFWPDDEEGLQILDRCPAAVTTMLERLQPKLGWAPESGRGLFLQAHDRLVAAVEAFMRRPVGAA